MEHVDVTIPLKEIYRTRAVPALLAASGKSNPMAVARVQKVVVNAGIGKFLKEEQRVEEIVRSITDITGQKPVLTQAKKAIAGFKIREGLAVGVKVTLRGDRMWDFLDRLIKTAFPRVRDFQGISSSVVDNNGHLNVGIREHAVFPEIIPEKVQTSFGLQVTVVTTAKTRDVGLTLAKSLGFPLRDTN
ncbi:MAG: 50S ribosomal protein L5 [Candidatus Moraniibacteriota bacterium]